MQACVRVFNDRRTKYAAAEGFNIFSANCTNNQQSSIAHKQRMARIGSKLEIELFAYEDVDNSDTKRVHLCKGPSTNDKVSAIL